MKRLILLSLSLLLLILGLTVLRSYRFERIGGLPEFEIADLKRMNPQLPEGASWVGTPDDPSLVLEVVEGQAAVSVIFDPAYGTAVEGMYVRSRLTAEGLVQGEKEWHDGRVFVQWRDEPGKGVVESDSVASASGTLTDKKDSMIARPEEGLGFATVRVDHRGVAGKFQIDKLEVIPVRERSGWFWVRIGLAVAWAAWILVFLSGSNKGSLSTRISATLIWVSMCMFFAFPGPWKTLTPFFKPFDLGAQMAFVEQELGEVGTELEKSGNETGLVAEITAHAAPKPIPASSAWIVRTKNRLKDLRILTHIAFYFLPAVAFVALVGKRRGTYLLAGLALAIEGSQIGFGFGFDYLDVLDLICAATAILLGRRVVGKFRFARSAQADG